MVSAPKEPWETAQRTDFRQRFGEDARGYDRARPVAPAVVFDDIVRLTDLHQGSRIVEIGPGTGQATRPLAERGLRILALEIDARLAARARRNLAQLPQAAVQTTSFEAWNPEQAVFDAVVACNSFHWIDPATRFAKAAGVLAPHGHLVLVRTPVVVPDDASRLWWDIQDDWAAVRAARVDPATTHPDLVTDDGPAVRASGLFHAPTTAWHRFDVTWTAPDYVRNLSTQSGVKALGPAAQAELLSRVRDRVDAQGGWVTVHHLAVVTVARRVA